MHLWWNKTPIKQRLLSLHDWHAKMKLLTEYRKEEYCRFIIAFFNFKVQCFGGLILPGTDYGTSKLCYFYTTYSWLQSDLCLTKVFCGSAEQFKDLTTKMAIT